jgi:hypothetical protein
MESQLIAEVFADYFRSAVNASCPTDIPSNPDTDV